MHNHRTTILSKCYKFTDVGIGVAANSEQAFFTQDFVFFTDSKCLSLILVRGY